MNIRVEDLQKILQNQIGTGSLMYISSNGIPFSITISDILSQVTGINATGAAVTNGQLISTSGALANQTAITGHNLYLLITGLSGSIGNINVQNAVYTTGNQLISGNKTFASPLFDTNGNQTVDLNNRQLIDTNQFVSLNWDSKNLFNDLGSRTLDWAGTVVYDVGGTNSLNWTTRNLIDNANSSSINWNTRQLIISDGSTVSIDWNNKIISGNWNSNNFNLSGHIVATANNLQSTGQTLFNLINASNAGVSSLNSKSGIINLTGAGNTTVFINGQTFTISGDNSSTNISNIVYVTGNQFISGNKIFLNNAGFSGNLSGTLFFVSNSGGINFGSNISNTDEFNYFNSITGGLMVIQAGSPLNNNSQTTLILTNQLQRGHQAAATSLNTPNEYGFSILRDDFEGQMSLFGDGAGDNTLYLYGLNTMGITFLNDNQNKDLNNFVININGGKSLNLGTGNLFGRSLILGAENNTNGDIGGNIVLSPGRGDIGFRNGMVIISGDCNISGNLLISGSSLVTNNAFNIYTGNQQSFTTGIISTGFDNYFINYPLGVFNKKPTIATSLEVSGTNMYNLNITGRSATGFFAIFSDIIKESGVIIHCIATTN